jgi:hypothetical protein
MVAHTEPMLLTLLDLTMVISLIVALFALPAMLATRHFWLSLKTTLAVLIVVAGNAALHYGASLLHF